MAVIWKVTTVHMSDIPGKCAHPAYEQIISIGPPVIPLIFAELATEPDDWFVALRRLTGVNPVPEASRGNLLETTNAWLHWACKKENYPDHLAEKGLPKSGLVNILQ